MGRPKKKLIQEVETRWNSTFFMLQRIYEEREAVGAALTSLNTNVTPLNSGQFEVIAQCLQALSAFNHATVKLSAEKVVTASKIIPIVRMRFYKINEKAQKLTSPTAIELTNNLIKNLKKCFGTVESLRTLAKATLSDPRFKTVVFGCAANADAAVKDCIAECSAVMREISAPPPESPQSSASAAATSAEGLGDGENLWELLDNKIHETQKVHSATADATVEVQRYLNTPYMNRTSDSLEFWSKHQIFFPHLFQLAKKYLSIPATSVPCERVFFPKLEKFCAKRETG